METNQAERTGHMGQRSGRAVCSDDVVHTSEDFSFANATNVSGTAGNRNRTGDIKPVH